MRKLHQKLIGFIYLLVYGMVAYSLTQLHSNLNRLDLKHTFHIIKSGKYNLNIVIVSVTHSPFTFSIFLSYYKSVSKWINAAHPKFKCTCHKATLSSGNFPFKKKSVSINHNHNYTICLIIYCRKQPTIFCVH